jgi:nitrite reductase (NO-forming)
MTPSTRLAGPHAPGPSGVGGPVGPPDRVSSIRRQARTTLAAAFAFVVVAPVAAVVPHHTGWWLPLHLFLAGGLLVAISGAAQFLAVTWAAGPAPSDRLAAVQRTLLVAGAAGLALAREAHTPLGVTAGGGAVLLALALLAWSLNGTVRAAVQRRFDVTLRWYLCALALGGVGISLGIVLASGAVSGDLAGRMREAHGLCNTLGLVGLVIAGTLPFFVATQAKMRMSPRRGHQRIPLRAMAGGVVVAAAAVLAGAHVIAGIGVALYLGGLVALGWILPRPGRRQLAWAGPRLVQLGFGLVWWAATVAVIAARALAGEPLFPAPVLFGLVLGGYAQVLAGSLAYLGPVLRGGGHERLSTGFAVTGSWPAVVAGNVAAASAVVGWSAPATAAIACWVTDLVIREIRRRAIP